MPKRERMQVPQKREKIRLANIYIYTKEKCSKAIKKRKKKQSKKKQQRWWFVVVVVAASVAGDVLTVLTT